MDHRKNWQNISNQHLNSLVDLYNNNSYAMLKMNSGYTIETGLKACYCNRVKNEDEQTGEYKTHNFDALLNKANLKEEFRKKQRQSPKFKSHWSIVSKWSPELRYNPVTFQATKEESQKILNAICDDEEGVKKWIENYW